MWIKVTYYPKKERYFPKGEKCQVDHEGGVANRGMNKGEIMVLRGGQVDIG